MKSAKTKGGKIVQQHVRYELARSNIEELHKLLGPICSIIDTGKIFGK